MKSHDNFSLRNIVRAWQSPSRSPTTHSHAYPGHEERMAAHEARIQGHPCPCGSGLTYGACCINRINQDALELAHRARTGAIAGDCVGNRRSATPVKFLRPRRRRDIPSGSALQGQLSEVGHANV